MNSSPNSLSRSSGFTLLEMLVVMLIAGLMVALVPPMFSGAVSGTKVKGAARNLAVALRESRSRAIIHNVEQRILLNLKDPAYSISETDTYSFPAGVRLSVETITGDRLPDQHEHNLFFFPDGSSSGELITVKGPKQAYHLHLDWITGNISISSSPSRQG